MAAEQLLAEVSNIPPLASWPLGLGLTVFGFWFAGRQEAGVDAVNRWKEQLAPHASSLDWMSGIGAKMSTKDFFQGALECDLFYFADTVATRAGQIVRALGKKKDDGRYVLELGPLRANFKEDPNERIKTFELSIADRSGRHADYSYIVGGNALMTYRTPTNVRGSFLHDSAAYGKLSQSGMTYEAFVSGYAPLFESLRAFTTQLHTAKAQDIRRALRR